MYVCVYIYIYIYDFISNTMNSIHTDAKYIYAHITHTYKHTNKQVKQSRSHTLELHACIYTYIRIYEQTGQAKKLHTLELHACIYTYIRIYEQTGQAKKLHTLELYHSEHDCVLEFHIYTYVRMCVHTPK